MKKYCTKHTKNNHHNADPGGQTGEKEVEMDYKTFKQAITLSEDLRASAIMAREAGEIVVWRLGGSFNTSQLLPGDILLYDGRKNPDDEFGIYDPPAVNTDVVLLMAFKLYQAAPAEFVKATSVTQN